MNEQIKDLLIRAGFSETYGLQEKERLNKFAELIVRECASAVFQMWFDDELSGSDMAAAHTKIIKHFGLEE